MPSLIKGQVKWVTGFKGLNDSAIPGQSPNTTPDLRNVKCRYGKIFGRGGMTEYLAITSAATSPPIIGLFDYKRVSGTNQLLRMTLTKLELLDTVTPEWDDVTGTAFSSPNTTRPQSCIIDDTLIMTPEGDLQPRKYTGSGNSATLGGTPPYCKMIGAYKGFLFAGDISEDGTFSDVTDGHRTLRYSDDWDATWAPCGADASITGDIVLAETPGRVMRLEQLARDSVAYKEDGAVAVTWIGNTEVFRRELLPFPQGLAAPLSLGNIFNSIHYLLGNDGIIYRVSSSKGFEPVTDEVLADTLHTSTVRDLGRYKYSRHIIDTEEGLYILLYDRTGLTGQFLNSYVAVNYISGEVTKGQLGESIVAGVAHRPTSTSREVALISTNTLVEEFDAAAVDDNGTSVDRYWTTGWQKLSGGQEGWFTGALIHMKRDKRARIRVSLAVDLDPTFQF